MSAATTEPALGEARERAAKWYYKELWGWDLHEICTGPVRETFLKSLLVCANGDGRLTPEERTWVLGRAAVAGAPDALLAELEAYPADENINEVVARTLSTDNSRRAVVYFAIKAASSDDRYVGQEREKIRSVAAAMGISAEVVGQIEQQVKQEARLKQQRIELCFPDGNPFRL